MNLLSTQLFKNVIFRGGDRYRIIEIWNRAIRVLVTVIDGGSVEDVARVKPLEEKI